MQAATINHESVLQLRKLRGIEKVGNTLYYNLQSNGIDPADHRHHGAACINTEMGAFGCLGIDGQ